MSETRLDTPVLQLRGVGPGVARKLEKLGIRTMLDLLLHLPNRYEDRSHVVPINQLSPEQPTVVCGQVLDSRIQFGKRRSLIVTIEDRTALLELRFFHFSAYQQQNLNPGVWVRAFGEARFVGRRLAMVHPEYELFDTEPPVPEAQLTPVYPATQGVSQKLLRKLGGQLTQLKLNAIESLPLAALLFLHQPPADANEDTIRLHQETVALDELTAYYLVMKKRARERRAQRTRPLPSGPGLGRALRDSLGFELTEAQRRTITEVLNDLSQPLPMLRLVQGDVGSGKTVVGAFAAVRAAEHGVQTAVLAPTEILAEQHYINFSRWLTPLGIGVSLLTGSMGAKARRVVLEGIASGETLVAVGTHALFQDAVAFAELGLTIVDEQHRFGVHQRMALRGKGATPHQLVMTATPIPRTLSMALYADMDVSVIDELPAGRQPVQTSVIANSRRDDVVARIRNVLQGGRQVYWVCTLIEESEELDAASAQTVHESLRATLPDYQIGLLHGRMAADDKARVMAEFKAGSLQLLVATTVIEVGVDVPNATLMVIENPERLGLAQLHQLRGRVGRGSHASHCVLLYDTPLSATARARLAVMRESNDGFYIAEKDLEIRGPGDLMGTRQTGEQQFRIADLATHQHLLEAAMRRGEVLLDRGDSEIEALLRIWAPAEAAHIDV